MWFLLIRCSANFNVGVLLSTGLCFGKCSLDDFGNPVIISNILLKVFLAKRSCIYKKFIFKYEISILRFIFIVSFNKLEL